MRVLHDVVAGLLGLLRRGRIESDLDEELRGYQEMAIDDRMTAGASREEAARAVRLAMGTREAVRTQVHEAGWEVVIETAWRDAVYGLRLLRRTPGFTAAVVLTLALGIGANTAIFTVVNAVLLRPLPYPRSDRIVAVGLRGSSPGPGDVAIPHLEFVREHTRRLLDCVAGYRASSDIDVDTQGATLASLAITENFFRVLGVRPAIGREISSEDMRAGGPTAIVLSAAVWRRLFHADPDIVGKVVALDDVSYKVVGVLPSDFTFVEQPTDVFVPIHLDAGSLDNRGTNTEVVARLRDGVTLSQLQAELNRLFTILPDPQGARGLVAVTYLQAISGDVRPSLLVLFGAVGLLLFAACANVASLVLARAIGRAREVAIRLATGATRTRLLRQGLTEGLVLAFIGASAGVLGAAWLLRSLTSSIPWDLPCDATAIRIDVRVLTFTLGASLITGLILALAWFWQISRANPVEGLKEGGRHGSGEGRGRARTSLVIVEVAMSVTLLVGATLLAQTLYNLRREKLGFDPTNLVTMTTSRPRVKHVSAERAFGVNVDLLRRFQALPAVTGCAMTTVAPLTRKANIPVQAYGHDDAGHSFGGTEIRAISYGYFETMRIRLVRGRVFSENDGAGGMPVAIINERLARLWWNGANPVGARIEIGKFRGRHLFEHPDPPREVIGVVADVKGQTVDARFPPMVYVPAGPGTLGGAVAWVVRSADPDIAAAIRRTVEDVDPSLRVRGLRTMASIIGESMAKQRFDALLLSLFAALAIALAAVGIYGVFNLQVNQHRHEMGIRVALGALPGDVLRQFLGRAVILAGGGAAIGIAAAAGLTRFLRGLLFGVQPTSVSAYVIASGLVVGVALFACFVPARRAMRFDPLTALREE